MDESYFLTPVIKETNLKTRIGITVDHYQGIPISKLLNLVRYSGLEFIEISKGIFEEIEEVIPKMKGLDTSFHLPLISDNGWDFSCLDHGAVINDLVAKLKKYQQRLSIKQYVAHPPEPAAWHRNLRTSFDFLLENLAKLDRPVYLENIAGLPLDDFLQLTTKAAAFLGPQFGGICYDGPHFYLSGIDPVQALLDLNNRVKYVHLSDCTRDRDSHLPFSSDGELPIDEILQALKTIDFNGWINLEIQPADITGIKSLVDSYLKVLRQFRTGKYIITRFKMLILLPLSKILINRHHKKSVDQRID